MNSSLVPTHCRALFFDAVGTLIHPEPSAIDVYQEYGRQHGCVMDRPTTAQRFRQKFDDEEKQDAAADWRVSEERERERWHAIVKGVFEKCEDLDLLFLKLWHHFSKPNSWRIADDAAEVISSAREANLTVGVASNFDSRLHRILDGWPVLAKLTPRVVSAEVGWRKPSAKFFEAVIQAAGCLPEEIVFVGDRPDTDVAGAEAAGLIPILLTNQASASYPCRSIGRLGELL